MKKTLMALAGIMCAVVVAVAVPQDVKAMQPSSQNTINDANAQIAAAQVAYQAALGREAQALANLNAVKASNPTELALTVAANAYTRAQGESRWYLDQVNNAKAYLVNITNRANIETAVEESRLTLGNLNNLQESKLLYESANGQAVNVANQIQNVSAALAGYQQAVAAIPAYQAQIDALSAQLVALQKEYAAKKALADNFKAVYESRLAANNYAYSAAIEDYCRKRDNARNHPANCKCDFCSMVKNNK